MRYLSIPKNVTLDAIMGRDGTPLSYAFTGNPPNFLDEYVWPAKEWRDHTQLTIAILDKLEGKAPGDVVELTDAEHEQLHKVLKSIEYPPVLARSFMRFQHAVASAPREVPMQAGANGKPTDDARGVAHAAER